MADNTADHLQRYGENMAASIAKADPPMSGAERAWAQQEVRDAQADAARLTDQN